MQFEDVEGISTVTRFSVAAMSVGWLLFIAVPAYSQPAQGNQPTCDGGTVDAAGQCACPAGFNLLPAASGETCVKTHAANCLGGDLTVAGACLCDGNVTMSGETYALEFVGGKCVPKRCPDHTYLKDGKCVTAGDNGFGFTCRTGYVPDEAHPGSPATRLHCVPDPTFCDPDARNRDDSCPKSSALAIDCFEGRCVCGGAHADWVNYLCQCAAPYQNVDGTCVSDVVAPDAAKPEAKNLPDQTGEPSAEPARRRWACWHGMIRLRWLCACPCCLRAWLVRYHGPFQGILFPRTADLSTPQICDTATGLTASTKRNRTPTRHLGSAACRAALRPATTREPRFFRCNRCIPFSGICS
jgi:hypothetical protein